MRPRHGLHAACPHAGTPWHDAVADHFSVFGSDDARTEALRREHRFKATDDIVGAADPAQEFAVQHIYWYTNGHAFNHITRLRALKYGGDGW